MRPSFQRSRPSRAHNRTILWVARFKGWPFDVALTSYLHVRNSRATHTAPFHPTGPTSKVSDGAGVLGTLEGYRSTVIDDPSQCSMRCSACDGVPGVKAVIPSSFPLVPD
jgi:hypothetical protein